MTVFFISGIGADERLFKHIRLAEGFQVQHLAWIEPLAGETIAAYATRLARYIDTSRPFALVGLSLGGIVAAEIAAMYAPVCTVLISSVLVAGHLPAYYRLSHRLRLNRLLPATFFKIMASMKHIATIRKRENLRTVLRVIWSGDNRFIRWGMKAVPNWHNTQLPNPLFHIHGTRDEVFPIWNTKPTHVIPKAGHMLVISHAEQVNGMLSGILVPLSKKT